MKILVALGLVALSAAPLFAETIELVTYYPAPGGGNTDTGRLHASRGTIGNPYTINNPADPDPTDGTLLVSDRLWIGPNFTAAAPPLDPLHVVGVDNQASNVLFMPGAGGTLNVGIGTANPQYSLHVVGNIPAGGAGGVGWPRIAVESTTASTVGIHIAHLPVNAGAPTDRQWASIGYTENFDVLKINNSNTFDDNHLTITNAGNVGIGTNNPQQKLDVAQNTAIRVGNAYFSSGRADLAHFASNAWYDGSANWQIPDPARASALLQFADSTIYLFQRAAGAGVNDWPNVMAITPGGNVGFGTPFPAARLHVSRPGAGGVEVARFSAPGGNSFITIGTGTTVNEGAALIFEGNRLRLGMHQRAGLTITNTDAVGIGTVSPNFTLHVNGSAGKPGGGSWSNSSDIRLKKNVHPMAGVLGKMLALHGVTFEWKDPASQGNLTGTQMGMIGQEVEKVFPEWVSEDPAGMKVISIRGFEALTVETFREQQKQIEDLKAWNEAQQREIEELRRHLPR